VIVRKEGDGVSAVGHLAFDCSGPVRAVSKASAEAGKKATVEVDKGEVAAKEKNSVRHNPEG